MSDHAVSETELNRLAADLWDAVDQAWWKLKEAQRLKPYSYDRSLHGAARDAEARWRVAKVRREEALRRLNGRLF